MKFVIIGAIALCTALTPSAVVVSGVIDLMKLATRHIFGNLLLRISCSLMMHQQHPYMEARARAYCFRGADNLRGLALKSSARALRV